MNNYIKILQEKNPNLIIEKYSLNEEGQNNDVVIINDSLVFKFPKYIEGIEKLKREASVLKGIKSYITKDIPYYKYSNFDGAEVGQVFGGYKIVKGVSLRKNLFDSIQRKEKISKQLAVFLKELHSIPSGELDGCEINAIDSHKEWADLFNRIEAKLFKFMSRDAQAMVARNFNSFLEKSFYINKTIIHGDFGPSNIIFDIESESISGVIDFNEVSIGDPAIDIAALVGPFGYGEEFVRSFEPIYGDVEVMLERARFYASTFALQEALFGLENDDKEAFSAGIKQYL